MCDSELVLQVLQDIDEALGKIATRFAPVASADDFTNSERGRERLDSICMLYLAVGEGLKRIDHETDNKLLASYEQVNWKGLKGLRDILSHHYFDVDAEQVFWVCKNELSTIQETIKLIVENLSNTATVQGLIGK